MRKLAVPALALALVFGGTALAAPPAPNTHYRWKDASGVVHFSDTIPASALAGGYDIVNGQGRVVQHVGRALTPAERAAARAAAAKAAAARQAAQQQAMADTQMLSAYPTVAALQHAQQGQLQQIETDINTLQSNLENQEHTLQDVLSQAAELQHARKPVPPLVRKRIAAQRDSVTQERNALVRRRADLANAKLHFAAQLQHYEGLRAKYGSGTP